MRITRLAGTALAATLLLAACSSGSSPTPSPSPAASPSVAASPSTAASASPAASPSAALACTPADLATVKSGTLTIGTDNPAYPPYFQAPTSGSATKPWELGDPTNGQGFESAVAYAVADKLGFTKDQVSWIVVPFDNAIAPGPKKYDFVINQVSYTPERASAVDLSVGYYDLNQAVVALKSNKAASATSLADLKALKLGAQVGTTSYDAIVNVIQPTTQPQVYNDNTGAIAALKAKQIDAIVVDLPTADYIANAGVEIDSGLATIVGQLPPQPGNPEHFSLALGLKSTLTPCVNQALNALAADGTLKSLASKWLPFQDSVPVLK